MSRKAHLVLEDGSAYEGEAFGAETTTFGEVVFNTSMTGYQEVLTDPSYAGQIVILTYPLIGNYGINAKDYESRRIQVAGFVVREHCTTPSHALSTTSLDEFLRSHGIPGISGLDTRAVTRKLRTRGVMMGVLSHESPEEALHALNRSPRYGEIDFVRHVTTQKAYVWDEQEPDAKGPKILVMDCGLKFNILRILRKRGCQVQAIPATASASDILSLKPNGIVLSPGPGDPLLLDYVAADVGRLLGGVPIMGICLGHQLVARALGGTTFKLKFGHRGANHPVRDLKTGRVYITAQNHGYAVEADSLPPGLEVSHINLNDGTVEGLRHREMPVLTVQYHSEASPGPWDNQYLFDQFLNMVKAVKA